MESGKERKKAQLTSAEREPLQVAPMPLQLEAPQSDERQVREEPWGGVPRKTDAMRNFAVPVMGTARERCLQSRFNSSMAGPAGKGDLLTNASMGLTRIVGMNPAWGRGGNPITEDELVVKRAPIKASLKAETEWRPVATASGRAPLPEWKQDRTAQAGMRFPKGNTLTAQFFSPGHASVSDNGKNNAECFFRHARPWGGQPAISYPSKTALSGTRYSWPPEK